MTHYYDKIGVAVVKLDKPLHQGDRIKIKGHQQEFSQIVESMQSQHQKITKADQGEEIGLKVDQPVKKGDVGELES